MAITLIVEDGTGVENANSYVGVATLRAFSEQYGEDMSILTDDQCAGYLLKAMLEIEPKDYKGTKTYIERALMWPRYGFTVRNFAIFANKVPDSIIRAQCFGSIAIWKLGISADTGPIATYGAIKSEVVGDLKTEYYDPNSDAAAATVNLTVWQQRSVNLLAPFVRKPSAIR